VRKARRLQQLSYGLRVPDRFDYKPAGGPPWVTYFAWALPGDLLQPLADARFGERFPSWSGIGATRDQSAVYDDGRHGLESVLGRLFRT